MPKIAKVDDDGNIRYRQRLSGELAVDLEFGEFPFDTQRLPINVISYRYTPDEIHFSRNTEINGDADGFSAAGWRMRIARPQFITFEVPELGLKRPNLMFVIEAERITRYYLLTMFLPMSLIVFMSWTVFWLQPMIVPPRIAISTAAIFSLIAFGFSIRMSLPWVSYMTRADLFVIGCTFLVFLALGVAVIGSRWASGEKQGQALRLNAAARWVSVALFCLVVIVTMTV